MNKYIESVSHLKKKLEKGVSYEKTTGIGKTVRNLSKQQVDNDIGKTAKLLCLTWKAIVKEQQEREEQEEHEDNDQQEEEEEEEEYEPEVKVKDEPEFDSNAYESSEDRNDYKIKSEYNESEEELNESNGDSKSDSFQNEKRKSSRNEHKYESKSDKKHKKHKSSHKSRESEANGTQPTEFEALLGLNDQIIKNNKKSSSTKKSDSSEKYSKKSNNYSTEKSNNSVKSSNKVKEKVTKTHSSSHSFPKALDSKTGLKSLEHSDILSSLPTFNYRPLPNRELIDEKIESNRKKTIKPNEDLSINVQSKKGRTAVFAGQARTKTYTHVHSLEELSLRVLMDNIDKMYYLGDAPYYLLKPVLQKCSTKQLSRLERINPHIMEETDELWEQFCKKEYRGREPDEDEDECWRDLYYRCGKEREDKLKNITKHITHRQTAKLPVRQTQFSENVKTPREILRKQERSGITHSIAGSSSSHSYSTSGSSSNNFVKIVPEKPKTAPLMKKALKLQKARYRK